MNTQQIEWNELEWSELESIVAEFVSTTWEYDCELLERYIAPIQEFLDNWTDDTEIPMSELPQFILDFIQVDDMSELVRTLLGHP